MRFLSDNNEKHIIDFGDKLAGSTLTTGIARLYSQHTKLQAGKEGLPSWKDKELYLRIEEAENLIIAALSLSDEELSNCYFRRAAEILEWTATIIANPSGIPTVILAAAAYQLGGYPARSLGVLSEHEISDDTSKVLEFFLRGDFLKTQEQLMLVFQSEVSLEKGEEGILSFSILNQVLRAIGVLVSWLRWGRDERIETAIKVLENVAKASINDVDTYSWLLAILVSKIARKYKSDALWEVALPLSEVMSSSGKQTLSRYLKTAFTERKSLTWPSQREGLRGLTSGESFALCTPTGSGKTRVAELAILQSLFPLDDTNTFNLVFPPVVLYLAPSKALSSEVEGNLAKILSKIKADHISVTSMYGGNDIGPSDVLMAPEQPTVLISTHEKADALIRYLGIELFARISCVIIDEAHTVSFAGKEEELCTSESRSLRLEILVSRLKTICSDETKFIALSAVASDIQDILSEWTSSTPGAKAIAPQYRSTRQVLGQLQCAAKGNMSIQYDVLDGNKLILKDREESPYIPKPFPSHPEVKEAYKEDEGIEKKMRAHLLWAAMHFAVTSDGKKHSVLISATEHPEYYAETFLILLKKDWKDEEIPMFFEPPKDEHNKRLMNMCLDSCEDYFGKTSREYRLLEKGIVLHHGKMPLIMSRFLIELIQAHVVTIVLATSTLSEGINLPFETVLIPSLRRVGSPLSSQEAINLMGRAGRPGVSTEGRSLVLLAKGVGGNTPGQNQAKNAYANIINTLIESRDIDREEKIQSPLRALIIAIYSRWRKISKSDNYEDFITWLESVEYKNADNDDQMLFDAVDTFDQQLLSAIEEMEQMGSVDNAEEFLQSLWRNTLGYYDSKQDLIFENIFIRRGTALINSIYPDRSKRSQMYYTGLPPRDALVVLDALEEIKGVILKANDYLSWEDEGRVQYFIELVSLMGKVSSFSVSNPEANTAWQDVLKWWIAPGIASKKPTRKNISKWYAFASKNFVYRFNWALGAIFGAILHRDGGVGTVLERWNQAGLPWASIWFKDLITWGVLDPVASFSMAKKLAFTRSEAGRRAVGYWEGINGELEDSLVKPELLYQWVNEENSENLSNEEVRDREPCIGYEVGVELLEDFNIKPSRTWQVFPVVVGEDILWMDPAGFPLAKSDKPERWGYSSESLLDFILDPKKSQIVAQSYI